MTGRFQTLIYTDCRPRQGLRGAAGLQFQARSGDTVAAAETMVKDNLLYEPPSRWMAERRPVEQYPPSFAHTWSGGHLATAAGVYLGREVNGSREGNQLTHAIVTTDPADYAGLRPAQLFGAEFWTTDPAPTTRSEPVDLKPGAGTYPPARARDFVLAQPDGPQTLLALVSALAVAGLPGCPRVLFVGDQVPSIVEWLVAGTLLVPRERALQLGFKVFSTDPARCALPVIAVPTEFAGPAGRIDNQLGYVVFDLDRGQHTPVPPTTAARRWVPLFLHEDPRDVVDALDVAAESGIAPGPAPGLAPGGAERVEQAPGGAGHAEEVAAALGRAAILRQLPDLPYAEAIVDWLRTGPRRLREAYGLDIAELFAETPERWPRSVLVLLDRVGCDGLLPGKAADVRLALIISEVDAARTDAVVIDEPLPPLPDGEWATEHDTHVFEIVAEALTCGVSPAAFDALLRVASRLRVSVRPADLGEEVDAFVRHWAENPRSGFEAGRWPCGDELTRLLIAELARRAAAGLREEVAVGEAWGRRLLPRLASLPPQLARATLGAAVWHMKPRIEFVEEHLAKAGGDPHRFGWTVDALWSQTVPTIAELRLVCDLAPAGTVILPPVLQPLVDHVVDSLRLDTELLALTQGMVDRGLLVPAGPLARVLADDDALTATIRELRTGHPPDRAKGAELVRDLRGRSSRTLAARVDDLVEALLRVVSVEELHKLLRLEPSLVPPYLDRLCAVLRSRDDGRPASVGFYLHHADGSVLEQPQRSRLGEALEHWLVRASDRGVADAGQHLAELGKAWRGEWEARVAALAGRRRRYRLAHPFGGR